MFSMPQKGRTKTAGCSRALPGRDNWQLRPMAFASSAATPVFLEWCNVHRASASGPPLMELLRSVCRNQRNLVFVLMSAWGQHPAMPFVGERLGCSSRIWAWVTTDFWVAFLQLCRLSITFTLLRPLFQLFVLQASQAVLLLRVVPARRCSVEGVSSLHSERIVYVFGWAAPHFVGSALLTDSGLEMYRFLVSLLTCCWGQALSLQRRTLWRGVSARGMAAPGVTEKRAESHYAVAQLEQQIVNQTWGVTAAS